MSHTNLIGKTVTAVSIDGDTVHIHANDGETEYKFVITHFQDCCESVNLEESYNADKMVGRKIIDVHELVTSGSGEYGESYTITKYIFDYSGGDPYSYDGGTAMLTWHGHSNGYYGEGVSFIECDADGNYSRW